MTTDTTDWPERVLVAYDKEEPFGWFVHCIHPKVIQDDVREYIRKDIHDSLRAEVARQAEKIGMLERDNITLMDAPARKLQDKTIDSLRAELVQSLAEFDKSSTELRAALRDARAEVARLEAELCPWCRPPPMTQRTPPLPEPQ